MISVIVPIYKVEDFLHKCVDSIINQTYQDLEIILVDDGSPDNCGYICDEYAKKDSRIKVIHKKNGGLSDARNAGMDIATGDYISFIDSDDYIEENMYECMLNNLITENADICICGYKVVDYDGKIIKKISQHNKVLIKDEAFFQLMEGNVFYAIMCNKLFSNRIFKNKELRFPVGKIHEDEFLIHYIYGECNKICVLEASLYNYISRDSSIMHSQRKSNKEYDTVEMYLDRAYYFHKNNYENYAAQLMIRVACECVRVYKTTDHDEKTKERIRMIRLEFHKQKKLIELTSLKLFRRVGLAIFDNSFYGYCVWNVCFKSLEKFMFKLRNIIKKY